MELNEYQEKAMSTCTESCNNFSYMFTNLVGEVGEFASKIGKAIRKEEIAINNNILCNNHGFVFLGEREEFVDSLKAEAGDILWQLSGLCKIMGFDLEDVAQYNLEKLASRKERNVIIGDGDNR